MKKLSAACAVLAAALCAAAASAASAAADVDGQVIYGDDDRIDLYQTKDARLLALADSTAALFSAADLTTGTAAVGLPARSFGEWGGFCPDEPFYSQPNGAFCSGSLVGPDLLMTAGHCVTDQESCESMKFVFGFSIKKEGVMPKSVPASDVYGCKQLVEREVAGNGADWALIKLDRTVAGRAPLKVHRGAGAAKDDPVVVIGHPAGLPTKIAGGAKVRSTEPEGYFTTNLDTYGGNSGSAVFHGKTGEIVGILVRGETDYTRDEARGCRLSYRCKADECRGEDVTKIGVLAGKIPAAAAKDRVARTNARMAEILASLR